MSQTIDGISPQVTQSGDIINCHGAAVCPLRSFNMPESKHQAEFAARTKIWCPPGAREALERLMAQHNFTAPRLHKAWQANNLVWDDERARLVAKTHWLEPVCGYGMVTLMFLYFVLQGGALAISPGPDASRNAAALVTVIALYLGMIWGVIRFVITPYLVAKRIQPALLSIYESEFSKKQTDSDVFQIESSR